MPVKSADNGVGITGHMYKYSTSEEDLTGGFGKEKTETVRFITVVRSLL